MPYTGSDFSTSDVGENEVYAFDFVNDLLPGETIGSVTWTVTDTKGVDASASSRASGLASIQGTQVAQRINGMVAGARYLFKATVVTSLGNTLSLWSHAQAKTPA